MTSDHVFGSDQLTPDLLRGATFSETDGKVDAAEVRTFLDRVASSLEVYLSQDAAKALRAEFARNAEIAQQVLDAGQSASEQLRRQAAEDARRILDEARDATLDLRSSVDREIEQARAQVEAMRGGFIQELRDLYDRIGASLYRFERAAEDSHHAPIQEPITPTAEQRLEPMHHEERPSAPAGVDFRDERVERAAPPAPEWTSEPELPEGAKAPAWQQLPPEAYSPPEAVTAPDPAPAAEPPTQQPTAVDEPVIEDEPLAPGEPLVDLRGFGSEPAATDAPAAPEPAVAPEAPAPAEPAAPAEAAAHEAADLGGSWLDTPLDPAAGAEPSDPSVSHDDALAEALIASGPLDQIAATPGDDASVPADPTAPAPDHAAALPAPAPAPAAASADAMAVRQLILDSLAAGQTRETVETYLRDQLGMMEPGALIDAALTSSDQ